MVRQQTIGIAGLPVARDLRAPTARRLVAASTADDSSVTSRTASATPHALGTWTQEIAATTTDSNLLRLRRGSTSTAATDTSLIVALSIGRAAGVEAEDLHFLAGFNNLNTAPSYYWVAMWMPKGTRIASALRALIASDTCAVGVETFYDPALGRPPRPFMIGVDTANSAGVTLAGTSTWTELSSACPQAVAAAQVTVQGSNTAMTPGTTTLDLGIGSSGAETVVATWKTEQAAAESVALHYTTSPAMVNIPKGVRIAVRGHADVEAALVLTPSWRIA